MNRNLTDSGGFTLVEILVAMTIFAIGVLALTKLQIASMQGNSKANLITIGTAASQSMMEELLSRDYDVLVDTDGDGTGEDLVAPFGADDDGGNFGFDDVDGAADGTQNSADGQFTFFWNVAVNYPVEGTKTVNVITRWRERTVTQQISYMFVKGAVGNL